MKKLIGASLLALAIAACGAPDKPASSQPDNAEKPAASVELTPTRNAYFGDLHIHTQNSFDAYTFNVRRTPDDAYRFAMGQPIHHDGGYEIQMKEPPLDFLAVTDHGEYLGIVPAMDNPDNALSQTEIAKAIFGPDAADAAANFQRIGISFVMGQPIAEMNNQAEMNRVWAETVAAAERYYQPGKFTTFAGYEFTAMRMVGMNPPAAANLHRNVIFRDKAPEQIYTTLQSGNPEDLWKWMEEQRANGTDALAIPHNSNASNGWMFAMETYDGSPITEAWTRTRKANEPLVEITQIKGTSDTHPTYSPNDEWSDFEQYKYFIGSSVPNTVNEGDYVRRALPRGLDLKEKTGTNPYEFGLIGSSDTHIAAGPFFEDNYWGKFPTDGANAQSRSSVPPDGYTSWEDVPKPTVRRVLTGAQYSASGLAGVWAEANTREQIFDAMKRRETFATSGPRMKVRLFAGDYDASVLSAPDMLETAYAKGVPMGGNLDWKEDGTSPTFIALAVRDTQSVPIDRLQIIKVWSDNGIAREDVFDVACSGGEAPDPLTHRCQDNGASVDISTCETSPGTGAGELRAIWNDPSYDPQKEVAYYVRAIENPTCRWSTWDAVRAGTPPNPELPTTLQERAWSSPIWVE